VEREMWIELMCKIAPLKATPQPDKRLIRLQTRYGKQV
jgi:hypothetical protein